MAAGFFDIEINGQEFATTNEVVKCDPQKSAAQFMEIVGYGAASKLIVGLGNVAVQGGFSMLKYHDTAFDAWAWYQTAAAQFSGCYNVLVTKNCADGTTVAWLWTNAKVLVTVEEPMNITSITTVTFEGPPPALQP